MTTFPGAGRRPDERRGWTSASRPRAGPTGTRPVRGATRPRPRWAPRRGQPRRRPPRGRRRTSPRPARRPGWCRRRATRPGDAGRERPGRRSAGLEVGRAPELDGLLDEGQEVADLAAGGGVDPSRPMSVVSASGGVRATIVEPPAAEQQRHLARQQHPGLALAASPLGHGGRDHVEEPLVQQPAHTVGTGRVPVDDPDRRPPGQPVQDAAGRLWCLGDQGPDLAGRQWFRSELQRRRAEACRVSAEDLGCVRTA